MANFCYMLILTKLVLNVFKSTRKNNIPTPFKIFNKVNSKFLYKGK